MIWSVLASGTALFYALHGGWSARIARRIGALPGAWTLFSFSLPFFLVNLGIRGMPQVGTGFWLAWAGAVVGNVLAWYLFFSALRSGDLGLTYPLLSLTPVFVPAVEWFLLRELPSSGGLVGIGLVVAGVYLLNSGTIRAGVFAPFAALARDNAALKALAVAVIWSVTGTLDRVAVLESSPAFYAFMFSVGLSVLFLPLAIMSIPKKPDADERSATEPTPAWYGRLHRQLSRAGTGALVMHGLLFTGMMVLQMEALTMALASYVLSIKRAGAVVAVLLGYFAFREGDLGSRLSGAVVTLAGAFVLVVFG